MRQSHKTFKTLLLPTFTSTSETDRLVTIIVESPCCPSQARLWPEFYSTASLYILRGFLPESQCGFRKECRTITMVFAARQLQEKCLEQNVDLYSTYVDLTKAFHTVSRAGLWRILAKYRSPKKSIAIVQQLHDSILVRVQDNSKIPQPFPVSNGEKQGCVLAPTLISIMFSVMLMDAFKDTDQGISISYRTDGYLFNLRRLQAKHQGHTRHHQQLPVCWWLHPQRCFRSWHATQHWQVCRGLQQLWPHNQSKENWSYAPASPRKAPNLTSQLLGSTELKGQIYLPQQHILKKRRWWWSKCQTL